MRSACTQFSPWWYSSSYSYVISSASAIPSLMLLRLIKALRRPMGSEFRG